MPSSGDRPADEIEVTPEMIEAGANTLKEFSLPDGGEQEWKDAAEQAFKTMVSIWRKNSSMILTS